MHATIGGIMGQERTVGLRGVCPIWWDNGMERTRGASHHWCTWDDGTGVHATIGGTMGWERIVGLRGVCPMVG